MKKNNIVKLTTLLMVFVVFYYFAVLREVRPSNGCFGDICFSHNAEPEYPNAATSEFLCRLVGGNFTVVPEGIGLVEVTHCFVGE